MKAYRWRRRPDRGSEGSPPTATATGDRSWAPYGTELAHLLRRRQGLITEDLVVLARAEGLHRYRD
jgi:hypothetical protein